MSVCVEGGTNCFWTILLGFLQEFLSYMESHRQRGNSMFENMRTNQLQVWRKYFWECIFERTKPLICICHSGVLVLFLPPSYEPVSGIRSTLNGCLQRQSCWGRGPCLARVRACCSAITGCKVLPKDLTALDYVSEERNWDYPDGYSNNWKSQFLHTSHRDTLDW